MFREKRGVLLIAVLSGCPAVLATSGCSSKSNNSTGSGGSAGSTEATGKGGGGVGGTNGTAGGAGRAGAGAAGMSGAADGGGQDGGCEPCDSGSCDPNFCNVVLLMHFDGTDGGTTFTEVKGHAVTAHGMAQLSGATAAFGGSSGYFDGTTAYLTLNPSEDWNFGADDFTVELFVNFKGGVAAQTPIPTFFSLWGPTCSEQGWQLNYNVNLNAVGSENDLPPNSLFVGFSTTGSDEVIPGVAWTPPSDTWVHLAAVRHGGQFLYFVGGSLIGTQSLGGDAGTPDWTPTTPCAPPWVAGPSPIANVSINTNSTAPFGIGVGIGAPGTPNPQSFFTGYIDEARITRGVARYTSTFTPPVQEFPNQ